MSTDKKSKEWYSENAQEYTDHVRDPENSPYHAYYEKPAMYALLPNIKGKDVLSLGCGSGEDSFYLKKQEAMNSVGIDISPELIEIATESYPGCKFQVMDMERLDFPKESFDFAYSSLAMHYLEDWEVAFREVCRVLKPNSFFLFSCGHPIRSAMVTNFTEQKKVVKLEITTDNTTKIKEVEGDYLTKQKLSNIFGGDTVDTWHIPIGEIVNMAYRAGFLVEQIVEPRPTDDMKRIKPEAFKRLNKIPEFIIFKLIKINSKIN